MIKDVMVDIETLGTGAGCVILSIGARFFDPQNSKVSKGVSFYERIDIFDSLLSGLTIDPKTLEWWSTQSDEAKGSISFKTGKPLKYVLTEFSRWFTQSGGEKFWCQGPTFDAIILGAAYEKLGMEVPWKHWNVRDTRTVYDICGFDPKAEKREGVYHHALDDCDTQIDHMHKALSSFIKVTPVPVIKPWVPDPMPSGMGGFKSEPKPYNGD